MFIKGNGLLEELYRREKWPGWCLFVPSGTGTHRRAPNITATRAARRPAIDLLFLEIPGRFHQQMGPKTQPDGIQTSHGVRAIQLTALFQLTSPGMVTKEAAYL